MTAATAATTARAVVILISADNFTLNQAFRNQAKATFEVAIQNGRTPYFQFEGPPGPGVPQALNRYVSRYGTEPVIDLNDLGGKLMHEFHAWIGLSESTEESDRGNLQQVVDDLRELAADSDWHDAVFELRNLNGQHLFIADGFVNRRREEGERLDLFIDIIARRLPGSWGLIYERDDEMPDPPGPNAFRVRVLAPGRVVERPDPFLLLCNPVIED
jgi:hypothetical protein